MEYRQRAKIFAIAYFTVLTLLLYIIFTTPAITGYRLSLYTLFPWYFWFLIICCIALGNYILVRQAFSNFPENKIWLLGILIVITTDFLILLLPKFSGYVLYRRDDSLQHLGSIKDIQLTGYLDANNFYPVLHILSDIMSAVLNIELVEIPIVVNLTAIIVFILSFYLIASVISKNQKSIIIIMAFSLTMLIFPSTLAFTPSDTTFFYLPLIIFLYIYSRTNSKIEGRILFVISLLLVPFSHPEFTIMTLAFLISIEISNKFYFTKYNSLRYGHSSSAIIMLFVLFFVWFSTFGVFARSVRRLILSFTDEVFSPTTAAQLELIKKVDLLPFEFIDLLFRMHGQSILFLTMSLFICIIITYKFICVKKYKIEYFTFIFSNFFIVTFICLLITFTFDTIIGYGRALKWTLIFSVLLNSTFISNINFRHYKKFMALLLFLIIFSSSAFNIFNIYPSPMVKSYYVGVTQMELNGVNWLLSAKDEKIPVFEFSGIYKRNIPLTVGAEKSLTRKDAYLESMFHPPDHFGWPNNTLGQLYEQDTFLVISELFRRVYTDLYPKYSGFTRFTDEDYLLLNSDKTVDKLYTNGELYIWYIHRSLNHDKDT